MMTLTPTQATDDTTIAVYARATGPDRLARLALAENEDTCPAILFLLEQDDDLDVSAAAAYNPSIPTITQMSEWAKTDGDFNYEGIHAVTGTKFNEAGFDCEGIHKDGWY